MLWAELIVFVIRLRWAFVQDFYYRSFIEKCRIETSQSRQWVLLLMLLVAKLSIHDKIMKIITGCLLRSLILIKRIIFLIAQIYFVLHIKEIFIFIILNLIWRRSLHKIVPFLLYLILKEVIFNRGGWRERVISIIIGIVMIRSIQDVRVK